MVKTFGNRVVLRGVDLTINEGDFITLMGANGAGKTTLLHIVASLSKPTMGDIFINGYSLADLPANCAALSDWFRTKPYCTMI